MRWYYQEFRIEYNYDYDISLIIPLSLSLSLSLSLYLYRSLFRLFTVAIVGMSLFLSLSLCRKACMQYATATLTLSTPLFFALAQANYRTA